MADDIEFDLSEVSKLAADLGEVAATAGPFIRKAVEVTSRNIKDETRKSVKKDRQWSGAAAAISYDLHSDGHELTSEVGYDKDVAGGALGNIREFGAPGAPSGVLTKHGFIPFAGTSVPRAPHNDLKDALEKNQGDFQHGLETAVKDAERAAGL